MRVLHLTSEYPPVVHGGLGRHVDGLTRAQVGCGAQVWVLGPAPDVVGARRSPGAHGQWHHGVEVHRVDGGLLPSRADSLVGAMATFQRRMVVAAASLPDVDVVHAHDWMTAEAGRAIATTRGVPLVLTLHATEHGRRFGRLDEPVHRAVHGAERAALAAADRVVVCSAAMRGEAVAHGAFPDAVHVVAGGVDVDRWRVTAATAASARRRWATGASHLVVAAGRLEWEKGFSTLLRALPAVRADRPTTRLALAGRGSYRPVLEGLARELGVDDCVVWPGQLAPEDLAALFAAADVVVVPSRYEPFGLVALEAQAAGAPVVVTRAGGLADLVDDGETGRVIEPGDVDRLAEVLDELLGDAPLRQRLAEAARVGAAAKSWQAVAQSVLALYG